MNRVTSANTLNSGMSNMSLSTNPSNTNNPSSPITTTTMPSSSIATLTTTTTTTTSQQQQYSMLSSSILDQPISKGKKEVSLSSFSFLFSEMVQYCQSRVTTGSELEQKLSEMGQRIGQRSLDLCVFRDKNSKREIRRANILQYISGTVWRMLYGKPADALEKDQKMESRYMLYERDPLENRFVSLPKNLNGLLHCSYFTAGVILGCLNAAEFPATVRVVFTENRDYTVFLIDFDKSVIDRENLLSK